MRNALWDKIRKEKGGRRKYLCGTFMRQHISPFSFLLLSFPLCFGLNLSEHRSEAKFDNSKKGFAKNAAAHLART